MTPVSQGCQLLELLGAKKQKLAFEPSFFVSFDLRGKNEMK